MGHWDTPPDNIVTGHDTGRRGKNGEKIKQKQIGKCIINAVKENKAGLTLDLLGWGSNTLFPEASLPPAVTGTALGGLGMFGAATDSKGPGDAAVSGSLAYIGKQGDIASTILQGQGSVIAGLVGFWALTASSAYDLAKTGAAINSCINNDIE